MARQSKPPQPLPAQLSPDDMEKGIRRLSRRLEAVEAFNPATLDQADPRSTVRPLSADIETALSETFGSDTIEYRRFIPAARFDWPIAMGGIPHSEKVKSVAQDRQRSIQLLKAAIALLSERLEDASRPNDLEPIEAPPLSKRIFIVHGHDNEPKEAIARFLTSLGLQPIILHEQPSKGRTIIEKFRAEAADVGFAIVAMTADDQTISNNEASWRARQNVILELGFFLGALGSSRVAAIVKGNIEKPSDYDGVVYIPFDGGWKIAVSKELEAAGYEINWNVVMKG